MTETGNNWMRWRRLWAGIVARRLQLLALAFWLVMVLLARQVMVTNDLTPVELVEQFGRTLTGAWYGPLIYMAVYTLRPVTLFPASPLAILAGSLWGLGLGFVYGLLAGTLSAVIPYLAGRWLAVDALAADNTGGNQQTLVRRVVRMIQGSPFQSVLMTRLLYFPYDTVSVVAGSLRVAFVPFFLATALGNMVGTFAFVGVGASLEGDLVTGDVSFNPVTLVISFGVLAASIFISRRLKARQTNTLADESVSPAGQRVAGD